MQFWTFLYDLCIYVHVQEVMESTRDFALADSMLIDNLLFLLTEDTAIEQSFVAYHLYSIIFSHLFMSLFISISKHM